MNTDDRLLQILENSSCLSKGQLTGYLKHTLYPEELRAVELHLSSCALCNDALEGMETQLDIDSLLASMVPPVLPNTTPKEKPKEKKEAPVAAKPEKTETVIPLAKTTAQHTTEQDNKNDVHTNPFRPRKRWARPIGIAAALVLACGALWYFKFNKENSERQIAEHINQPSYAEPATDSERPIAMQAVAPGQQDSLNKVGEKKHSDSIYLAKREEQKLKAIKDSTSHALAANGDSGKGKIAAENQQSIAASKTTEADEKEQPEIAMKKVAAVPAVSKPKEESKDEPSDFELGMQKYKQKNYASALLYFKSVESDKGDPKHWEAVYYSGVCNRLLKKDRKARKLFERVIDAGAPLKKAAQKQLDDMKKAK
ncbi:MAG: hypothetical protein WC756_11830 [Taibaiella sp.]|jgi:hypothetical protein